MLRHRLILALLALLALATAAQAQRTVYQLGNEGMTIYQSQRDALGGSTVIEMGPRGTRVTVGQRGVLGGENDVTISAPWQNRPSDTATQMILDDLNEGE